MPNGIAGKKGAFDRWGFSDEFISIFFEEDDAIFNPDTGKIREGVDTLYETLVEDLNIFNVIQTKEYSARRKWKNKFKKIGLKIDVVLGSSDMDYYGPDENGIDILKKKLDLLDGFYDYIFIDFPPAHNLVTMMYLVACDYIIVPMHLAKGSSINGYFDVIDKCKEARKEYGNRNLRVLGLFYINVQMYKMISQIRGMRAEKMGQKMN